MSISESLRQAGFRSALIVDDAFDLVPIATDLAIDQDAWSNFIDDIKGEAELLTKAFPAYRTMSGPELRDSDAFVAAMYGLRGKLRDDLWETLFGDFERGRGSDRKVLEDLGQRLEALGLEVTKSGRAIPEGARNCSIIFADLFLGAAQQDFDIDMSIERIRGLIAPRASAPPPVVLMSRSQLLSDKKLKFRDEAKLVGALFRVYRKLDLLKGSTLETLLERFAAHYQDSVRVASFLTAWEKGLARAGEEFMRVIRRLDLSDYGKIREVLLDADGQPLGSYMLDVFDRVLQHEIEGYGPTISAAQQLNLIDSKRYPAPHIAGSADLQDLVVRSIWQNSKRLAVPANTAGMPVSFGDVLIRRSRLSEPATKAPPDLPDALVVLTPACDLVRKTKGRVMLVGGILKALDSKNWRYKPQGVSTPIVELPGHPRMSFLWELEDQRMLNKKELDDLTEPDGPYRVMLRLRDSYALEIQQNLLSHMGRVGTVSKMPFTFPVDVSVSIFGPDGQASPLDLPALSRDGGVCISGRTEDGKDHTRLILTEDAIDEILEAVPTVRPDQVHDKAKDSLVRLQRSSSFKSLLRDGLKAPEATANGGLMSVEVPVAEDDLAAVAAPSKETEDRAGRPGTEHAETIRTEFVAWIQRNPKDQKPSHKHFRDGALIIVLKDREQEAAGVLPTAGDAAVSGTSIDKNRS